MEILLVYSWNFDPGLLNNSTNDLKYKAKSELTRKNNIEQM